MSHDMTSAEQVVSLLRGELGREQVGTLTQHLRECDECRRELVEVAAAHGSLTAVARLLRTPDDDVRPMATEPQSDGPTSPLPPLRVPRARRGLVRVLAAGAAAVLVVGGVAVGVDRLRRDDTAPATSRSVALQPIASQASGRVTMAEQARADSTTRMSISTSGLDPAGSGHFYYAWLFDPATNKMLPLGVVSPDGSTRFDVADDLVGRYHAVDISLQDDNGNPAHSATSVLRAQY